MAVDTVHCDATGRWCGNRLVYAPVDFQFDAIRVGCSAWRSNNHKVYAKILPKRTETK